MSEPINRTYVLLGASLIVVVLGLLWLAGNVNTLRHQDGQRYTVSLEDAAGLPLGSPVRLAGVDVGSVEAVDVVEGRAMLTLVLEPEVELRADAAAGPRAKSLLGQKFVELIPGSESAPRLPEGAQIVNTWDSYEVDEALNALEPVFGEEGSLTSTMERFDALFGRLDPPEPEPEEPEEPKTTQEEVDELAEQIHDLRESAASARERAEAVRDELPGLLADANGVLGGRDLDRTLNVIDRVSASTARELPGLFDEGEQALDRANRGLKQVEDFTRGVTPERVAELEGVLDDVVSASAEAKATTAGLQGLGEDAGPLIDKLAQISKRATSIDELTIRRFLQQEGFLIRVGGGDRKAATDRMETLDEP